jgi:hypothetical protein
MSASALMRAFSRAVHQIGPSLRGQAGEGEEGDVAALCQGQAGDGAPGTLDYARRPCPEASDGCDTLAPAPWLCWPVGHARAIR